MMKRLNAKMYAESKRLKVKWILGGECGHMWRVIHQYMDTMNGPADFLEVPKSPLTGTVFDNAAGTKMVHITEFTADLIKHGKLKLDKSRNDWVKATFHDSCNPARGMGMFEEPRYVLRNVVDQFYDMPPNTIREQTFCCGSGSGLNAGENMEERLRGALPRSFAVRHVHEKFGVNTLACVCAIDRAALPTAMDYWVPGVRVAGSASWRHRAGHGGRNERDYNLRGGALSDLRVRTWARRLPENAWKTSDLRRGQDHPWPRGLLAPGLFPLCGTWAGPGGASRAAKDRSSAWPQGGKRTGHMQSPKPGGTPWVREGIALTWRTTARNST